MRIFRATEPLQDDKPCVSEDLWIPRDRCRVAQAQVEMVTAAGPIFLCQHHHKDHRASIVAAGHLIRAWPPGSGPCS
jgi:hypothetical protein